VVVELIDRYFIQYETHAKLKGLNWRFLEAVMNERVVNLPLFFTEELKWQLPNRHSGLILLLESWAIKNNGINSRILILKVAGVERT